MGGAAAPAPAAPSAEGRASVPLGHALMSHLMTFNLLPSTTLHPEQADQHVIPRGFEALLKRPETAALAHREWSASILQDLSLTDDPVCDLAAPALSVAMLRGDQLEQLAHTAGVALLAGRLRRMVARAEVTEAMRALGEDVVRTARARPLPAGTFVPDTSAWDIGQLHAAVPVLGYGVIVRALGAAPQAVRARAHLRLPRSVDVPPQLAQLESDAALTLTLQLLMELDARWCSLFPSIH